MGTDRVRALDLIRKLTLGVLFLVLVSQVFWLFNEHLTMKKLAAIQAKQNAIEAKQAWITANCRGGLLSYGE